MNEAAATRSSQDDNIRACKKRSRHQFEPAADDTKLEPHCKENNLLLPTLPTVREITSVPPKEFEALASETLLSILGTVNKVAVGGHILSKSGLLEMHECLEKERAKNVLVIQKKLHILLTENEETVQSNDETVESLTGWKFRVAVLKELIMETVEHTFRAGESKHQRIIIPPLRTGPIDDECAKTLVEIMVDIESTIWQEAGVINGADVDTVAFQVEPAGGHDVTNCYLKKQSPLNRSKFRSDRRGLWKTAVTALRKDRQQLKERDNTNDGSEKDFITQDLDFKWKSRTFPTGCTQQAKRWRQKYYRVRANLGQGKFLNENFRSDRVVTDCPVLIEAQSSTNRKFISSNCNPTCTAVGLFEAEEEGRITPLSPQNEKILVEYIDYLKEMELRGKHFLGPHFCHKHEGIGYALHLQSACKAGHFFLYQGECKFEGDRVLELVRNGADPKKDVPDDLFCVIDAKAASAADAWSVCIDASKRSNFARYVGGVSPSKLNVANCLSYTVKVAGFYRILIVLARDGEPGEALQYYYRGLSGEGKFGLIPKIAPPSTISTNLDTK